MTDEERARAWLDEQTDAYVIGHWRIREAPRHLATLLRDVREEEREACAREAERNIIEYAEIDVLDTTPERLRIARRIRARGPR